MIGQKSHPKFEEAEVPHYFVEALISRVAGSMAEHLIHSPESRTKTSRFWLNKFTLSLQNFFSVSTMQLARSGFHAFTVKWCGAFKNQRIPGATNPFRVIWTMQTFAHLWKSSVATPTSLLRNKASISMTSTTVDSCLRKGLKLRKYRKPGRNRWGFGSLSISWWITNGFWPLHCGFFGVLYFCMIAKHSKIGSDWAVESPHWHVLQHTALPSSIPFGFVSWWFAKSLSAILPHLPPLAEQTAIVSFASYAFAELSLLSCLQ